jgi:superfamily II RNA helicase
MRITIQQRRVITKKLPHTLYKPRQYQFKSTRFKTRSEQDIKQCEKELESLEERIHESDSQVADLQQRIGLTTSIDERTRLRKLQVHTSELKDLANRLRNGLARKKTELNTTKTLTFIFGLNIPNRAADGVFVYNCGRLIKMYEKIGQPNKKTLYV